MGTIQNNAIIVTGFGDDLTKAHEKAKDIFNKVYLDYKSVSLVTPIVEHITNGDCTFMIAPDGSKEGWDLSDEFDKRRNEFINWLKNDTECLSWVHVSYGEISYSLVDSDCDY